MPLAKVTLLALAVVVSPAVGCEQSEKSGYTGVIVYTSDCCPQCVADKRYYPQLRRSYDGVIIVDVNTPGTSIVPAGLRSTPTYVLLRYDANNRLVESVMTTDIRDLLRE